MEKSAKNKFSKIFEKLEAEVKRNKSQAVEPIVEEVVEEEVQLSEKEEKGLDLFSNLMESLSDDNKKETEESEIQDDPTDDVGKAVSDWIKKDVEKNDKKVEALGELFAPLLPEDENFEPVVEETSEIPDELLKEFQEKPVQPKKPKPISKAVISVEEQKYFGEFLDEISKLPPEEKTVDVSEQSFPNAVKDSLLTPDETSQQRKAAQPIDSLTRLRNEFEQFRTVMQRQLEAKENAFTGNSGSGAVKIQDMDDVDTDSALVDGRIFRFNATKGKFDGVDPETENLITEDGDFLALDGTNSDQDDAGSRLDLEDGTFGGLSTFADSTVFNDGRVLAYKASTGKVEGIVRVTEAIVLETNEKLLLEGTDSDGTNEGDFFNLENDTFGSVGFDNIAEDIIPDQNNVRSLGSDGKRFKDLFLSGQTIDLGGATISSDGSGTVTISSDGVTLPEGSKIQSDNIAIAGSNGKTSTSVEFFSRAGGTSTANATFKFQSKGLSYVFTDSGTFTLSDGTAIEDQNPELFTF